MEPHVVAPTNEQARLAALRRYGILDTPPERTFDRITALAAEVFDVPLALITLVDETRSWWKSHFGTDVGYIPREIAPCNIVILQNDLVVVSDCLLHDVYGALESMKAFGVRFYAAAPLYSDEGYNLGTLCVADPRRPHECTERERQILADLASVVIDELELRRAAARLIEADRVLLELNARLEETSRNKSDFLARMSHELRTPLNAIMGASELLDAGLWGHLSEKQTEYVHHINTSGAHLLSLINDVLDISKVEAGIEILHAEPVSLHAIVQASADQVRPVAVARRLTLDVATPPPDTVFDADERKLKQVLVNVLSNAVWFTPEGGRVSLSATAGPREVVFTIEDSGPGIAAEYHERIFEEFFQVPGRPPVTTQPGTGLGLAIAKRLIELHAGRIWVDASASSGSRFCVAVPAGGSAAVG